MLFSKKKGGFPVLDKEDLQAIQKIISGSEDRMLGKIQKSEDRMLGKIQESEDRAVQKAMVMMEQYFDPKFNLLAENQQMILEKMVPLSRVEKIEGDVDLLKIIIRQMREEIDQLKGA